MRTLAARVLLLHGLPAAVPCWSALPRYCGRLAPDSRRMDRDAPASLCAVLRHAARIGDLREAGLGSSEQAAAARRWDGVEMEGVVRGLGGSTAWASGGLALDAAACERAGSEAVECRACRRTAHCALASSRLTWTTAAVPRLPARR